MLHELAAVVTTTTAVPTATTLTNPNTASAWVGRLETTVTLMAGLVAIGAYFRSHAERFVDLRVAPMREALMAHTEQEGLMVRREVRRAIRPLRRAVRHLEEANRRRDEAPR